MLKMMMTVILAALTLPAAVFAQAAVVEPGDEVAHDFRGAIVNGMGASSLEDFHGKPLLVEFWGHR
jgi:hypothetical protein